MRGQGTQPLEEALGRPRRAHQGDGQSMPFSSPQPRRRPSPGPVRRMQRIFRCLAAEHPLGSGSPALTGGGD